jgi:hypothetical protein
MTIGASRIGLFDIWQPSYGGATVRILRAGTNNLAAVYTDPDLTERADNPQVLERLTVRDVPYGKWKEPLYTADAVTLDIDGGGQTGLIRPAITSLESEIADNALAKTQRGSRRRRLIERFNDVVHALDFGKLGGSSKENTETFENAIGAVAGQGGGQVILPAGRYVFTSLSLPDNVILFGQNRGATVLASEEGTEIITINGDAAGLVNLELDGVSLQGGSVGVFAVNRSQTVFRDCRIRRFNTGMYFKGGDLAEWSDLYVKNCETGAFLSGDSDAGATGNGGSFEFNLWQGGGVRECTSYGIRLNFEDQITRFNRFKDLDITQNPDGSAVQINGARYTKFEGCAWSGNNRNIEVQDDSDTSFSDINTVRGLRFLDCYFNGGDNDLQDECGDVVFERCSVNDVDWTLTAPDNPIILIDTQEDANVTVSGETARLLRQRTTLQGEVEGVTTDNSALTAYALPMESGEVAYLEAEILANQRDGENYGVWHISVGARRPGADLDYDEQVENFVVGEQITGGFSGATARIIADSDSGSTGTLTLRDIQGTFSDNETITGTNQGQAKVNGTITTSAVTKDSGGDNAIRAAVKTNTNYDAAFAVSGGELQVEVTGDSGETLEWKVNVKALLN